MLETISLPLDYCNTWLIKILGPFWHTQKVRGAWFMEGTEQIHQWDWRKMQVPISPLPRTLTGRTSQLNLFKFRIVAAFPGWRQKEWDTRVVETFPVAMIIHSVVTWIRVPMILWIVPPNDLTVLLWSCLTGYSGRASEGKITHMLSLLFLLFLEKVPPGVSLLCLSLNVSSTLSICLLGFDSKIWEQRWWCFPVT